VITAIDIVNQRISLSMKELLPNEWEEYANAHGVGDIVGGVVTNVTDFGVFVELAPGVEGLCHVSEIDLGGEATLHDVFGSGQKVLCRILRIDWNENRIGLSMHGVSQDGAEEAGGPESPEDMAAADTAMAAALKASGLVTHDEDEAAAAGEAESGVEAGPERAETAADAADETAGDHDAGADEPEEAREGATGSDTEQPAGAPAGGEEDEGDADDAGSDENGAADEGE